VGEGASFPSEAPALAARGSFWGLGRNSGFYIHFSDRNDLFLFSCFITQCSLSTHNSFNLPSRESKFIPKQDFT
jgi:hypothetical protein